MTVASFKRLKVGALYKTLTGITWRCDAIKNDIVLHTVIDNPNNPDNNGTQYHLDYTSIYEIEAAYEIAPIDIYDELFQMFSK